MLSVGADVERKKGMSNQELLAILESNAKPEKKWQAFARLQKQISLNDLPLLIRTIQSNEIGCGIREWLAEPILRLGGISTLPLLLQVLRMNFQEGHDNDSLQGLLTEFASKHTDETWQVLEELMKKANYQEKDDINWLLEYCR